MTTTSLHAWAKPDFTYAADFPTQHDAFMDLVDATVPLFSSTEPPHVRGLVWYSPTDHMLRISSGSAWANITPVRGSVTSVFSSDTATAGTVTFSPAFVAAPDVYLSVQVGGNLDICVDLTADPTTSGFSWRLFQKDGVAVSGTVKMRWMAYGT